MASKLGNLSGVMGPYLKNWQGAPLCIFFDHFSWSRSANEIGFIVFTPLKGTGIRKMVCRYGCIFKRQVCLKKSLYCIWNMGGCIAVLGSQSRQSTVSFGFSILYDNHIIWLIFMFPSFSTVALAHRTDSLFATKLAQMGTSQTFKDHQTQYQPTERVHFNRTPDSWI